MIASLISNLAFLPDEPARDGSPIWGCASANSWNKKYLTKKIQTSAKRLFVAHRRQSLTYGAGSSSLAEMSAVPGDVVHCFELPIIQ